MPVETDAQGKLYSMIQLAENPPQHSQQKKQGVLADALLMVSQLNQGKFMRGAVYGDTNETPLVASFKELCRTETDACWTLPSVRARSPFFWCRS